MDAPLAAHLIRGRYAAGQGDYQKAIGFYTNSLESITTKSLASAETLFWRALAFCLESDLDKALADFAQLLERPEIPDPFRVKTHFFHAGM